MDTTGTLPAVTGHLFSASHKSPGFGWVPAAEQPGLVRMSILSSVDSGSLWRRRGPWLSERSVGSMRLRSGGTPLTRALTFSFCFMVLFLTVGGDEAFFPT